jgi:hypothetical protein
VRGFIIFLLTEYNPGYYNQKYEMSGACSTYEQKRDKYFSDREKNKNKFLEELDINGRAMLTWVLEQYATGSALRLAHERERWRAV